MRVVPYCVCWALDTGWTLDGARVRISCRKRAQPPVLSVRGFFPVCHLCRGLRQDDGLREGPSRLLQYVVLGVLSDLALGAQGPDGVLATLFAGVAIAQRTVMDNSGCALVFFAMTS